MLNSSVTVKQSRCVGGTLRFGRVETDTPLRDSVSEFTYQTCPRGRAGQVQSDQAPVAGIMSAAHLFHVGFSVQNLIKC